MFSSSKFSLKHTFKKASSLILGNQLSLYFFPFKWTRLCRICLRNSAGPQLLTPTYWGEVKKCDNCRSWQQSLRALWDKMSPDSFSTHWFPTKGMLLIPLPLVSMNPDLSGCSKKMNSALPAKSTHSALDQLHCNGHFGFGHLKWWHRCLLTPRPTGIHWGIHAAHKQLAEPELSLPVPTGGCQTWIWDWPLKDKFLSHQGIFWLADTDLGQRPIPASPGYFLQLGNNLHFRATEFQSLFPPLCQNTML